MTPAPIRRGDSRRLATVDVGLNGEREQRRRSGRKGRGMGDEPTSIDRSSDHRICLVALTNNVSGTERVVSDIARAVQQRDVPVAAMVPGGAQLDGFASRLAAGGVEVARIGSVTGKRSLGRNLVPAARFFRAWRPTTVHFHCPHHRWGLDVLLAARVARVPRVVRTEQNPLMTPPGRVVAPLLRMADAGTDIFTYVSTGNQRRFESLLPRRRGRGTLVENGIDPDQVRTGSSDASRRDLRRRFGLPDDCRVAVYVGSFGDRRSLRQIFEAFCELQASAPTIAGRWRVLVIGAGPQDEQALPAVLGIEHLVVFAGWRPDVHDVLPQCDMFVTASAFEGMSIAILEAWASGLPVLARSVDGLEEVLGAPDFRAMTVESDGKHEFARKWLELMVDDGTLRARHERAGELVRRELTTSRMIEKYVRLYQAPAPGTFRRSGAADLATATPR